MAPVQSIALPWPHGLGALPASRPVTTQVGSNIWYGVRVKTGGTCYYRECVWVGVKRTDETGKAAWYSLQAPSIPALVSVPGTTTVNAQQIADTVNAFLSSVR